MTTLHTNKRRIIHTALSFVLAAGTMLSAAGAAITAHAAEGGFTVVRQDGFAVAPGVQHTGMKLEGGGHIEAVNMMEVDPANPAIKLEVTSPKGKVVALDTVRNQAKQIDRDGYRVVGAFNMDFYNTDPAYAGVPNGLQVSNGELITAPSSTSSAIAIMADGTYKIAKSVGFTGSVTATTYGGAVRPLSGVNRVRSATAANQLVLYTERFSATTKTTGAGTEAVLVPDSAGSKLTLGQPIRVKVESVAEASGSAIPAGKLVLSATGADAAWLKANLAAGQTVELNLQLSGGLSSAVQAVGGGVMLVENGLPTTAALADNVDRHPRTFAAAKAGKLYFFTFDGRQPTYSDGVTLAEGAQYLQGLGMETAVNVDGGGSTTYAARLPGDQTLSVLNQPSDGYERSNSNSLMVVSTAPVTELKYLVPHPKGPVQVLTGSQITFTSKGQDVSYNGVPVDPAGLLWQADGAVGTITAQGAFTAASTPGSCRITIRSGSVTQPVDVTVTDRVYRLAITPEAAIVNPGASQTFTVQAFDAAGGEILLSPDRLSWSKEGDIGTLSADGVLVSSTQIVSGKVVAAFGGVKAEAAVNIGKPPVLVEDFEDITDIAVSSARANTVKLDLMSRSNPVRFGTHSARLTYDFTGTVGTSAAYLNFKDDAGAAGRPLEGYPAKLGLWVYGDGKGHWLRGQIQDGNGTKKPVDFTGTDELGWIGWKYVAADIPSGMAVPLRLTQLYVVETSNANKNAGAVYFDHLRAIYSDTGEDLEGPVFSGLTPAAGAKVYTGMPAVNAVIADKGQGVDAGSISMTLNNKVVAHQYNADTGKISYTPDAPLPDGTYKVAIDAVDRAGNPALPKPEWSFTVYTGPDVDKPVLSVVSPMDGITTRTDRPRIAIRASDDYSGVDESGLKLELDGAVVQHQYDVGSGTLYYTPVEKLAIGSQHQVRATAVDRTGNEAAVQWSFTVGILLGQPAQADKFQMSVIGDGGYYTAGQGQTAADILLREQINRINAEPSELVGYTGDIVENDTAANFAAGLQNMNLFRAPYVVTIGNHEVSGTGSRVNYQKAFGETTYFYDYGNTRIIGLDSASGILSNSDASQWPWLEETLEQTANPNILIFKHVPPDEINAQGEDLKTGHGFQNPEEAKRIYDLLGAYKQSHQDKNMVVFSGDLHAYEHKQVQGVEYVISGGGGKYTHVTPEKGGFYHYLNVKIDGGRVTWDVIPLLDQIAFTAKPDQLGVKQTFQLKADGKFLTSTNDPITLPVAAPFKTEWTSSRPDIAAVDAQGLVTAKAGGEAVVTVKSGNREAQTTIRVSQAQPTGQIELSGLAPMLAGDSLKTQVSALMDDGSKLPLTSDVQFASSEPRVAQVSQTGSVLALEAGETVITATYGSGKVSFSLQVSPYAAASVHEKIMAKNSTAHTLELEYGGTIPMVDEPAVRQAVYGQAAAAKTLNDVRVGAENVDVYRNRAGQAYLFVIDGDTPMDRMRVGIRKDISNIADITQIDHGQVDLQSAQAYRIVDKVANRTIDIPVNAAVYLAPEAGQLKVTVNGSEMYRTANRLYAVQGEGSLIRIASITRAHGKPQYRGVLEFTLSQARDKLRVTNELNIEQYLYQVVPSEMPASFGLEALKAQAIAARTYALADYMSSRFADLGFHIDDSTLSQVYNNQAENDLTTLAVGETAGIIMRSGNDLVDARFYSTSGGYGAGRHEVWSDAGTNRFPGTPAAYLTACSYTYDPADSGKLLQIDTQNEQQINAFYRNLSLTGYDSDSLYFRWKVGLSRTELQNTINANLAGRYTADPNSILTREADGSFVSKPIPAAGIGTLTNIYVTKRGSGGSIMELVIEGSTGTYKIVKEFNIRFTIRPSKTYTGGADVLAYRAKGGAKDYDPAATVKNPSILYSAFFTFDLARDANGDMTGVTFYGGGNGHGVGMSQFGASALGAKGWGYDKILNAYYSGMQLTRIAGTEWKVTGIRIDGLPPTMKPGDMRQTVITGTYSNGSSKAIDSGVAFASSDPKVASVSPSGLVTASGFGKTTITASYGGQTASIEINIVPEYTGLEAAPLVPMKQGQTQQTVVNAVYSDGTKTPIVSSGIVFTSDDPKVATVNANGMVTAGAIGNTTINAAYEGKTVAIPVQVTAAVVRLELGKLKPMKEGETAQLTVTAFYTDKSRASVTTAVYFTSTDPSVATVSMQGLLQALKKGKTEIRASYAGQTAEERLVVTPSKKEDNDDGDHNDGDHDDGDHNDKSMK